MWPVPACGLMPEYSGCTAVEVMWPVPACGQMPEYSECTAVEVMWPVVYLL